MAYIGNTQQNQNYVPAIDYFSGNGSTTAFTLSRPVASVAQVQAVIENVPQNPGDAYTVSGNTITFTSAPPSGTNNIYIYYTSPNTQVTALPQSPVVYGNLNFGSTGARIQGDFSGSPVANRVAFQTTGVNTTDVGAIPPTGYLAASFIAFNSTDASNASFAQLRIDGGDARFASSKTGTGSYLPMTFYTGGGEKMRIDTSGNVGIGTSSPTNRLAVNGGAQFIGGGATFPTTGTGIEVVAGSDSGENYIQAYNRSNSTWQNLSINSGRMAFGTAGSERMRIDSNGNVLVGASSTGSWAGGSAIGATGYIARSGRTGSFVNNLFNINWTGSAQLWIDTTNVGTFAFTSDYRIKQNIQTNTMPALERIEQLRPVTYEYADYKELFKEDGVQREGFIAHELAEVIPSAVEGEKDAEDQIQSLKLDALCSVMVKAIQELKAIVDEQAEKIKALEAK